MSGLLLEPEILARAEPMARPVLSQYLLDGASTEAGSTLAVYAEAILRAAAELGDDEGTDFERYEQALPALLDLLRDAPNWDQLWSRVPDGVEQALGRAKDAGLKLVVVSNSDGGIDKKLERGRLLHFFDDIVDSGTVGVEKPDPRIFEIALERAGCAASEAVHVGDLESIDVRGARAAGVRGVLLDPYGDWMDATRGHRVPDCETAPDVPTLVDRLIAERVR